MVAYPRSRVPRPVSAFYLGVALAKTEARARSATRRRTYAGHCIEPRPTGALTLSHLDGGTNLAQSREGWECPQSKQFCAEPRSAGWMTSPARTSRNRRYALCLAPASRVLTLRANPCGFGYPPLPHSCAVRPLRGRRAFCVHTRRKFLTPLFRFSHHPPRNHAG